MSARTDALVDEYWQFIKENEDLHFCSLMHLLNRLPDRLHVVACAHQQHIMLYGDGRRSPAVLGKSMFDI